MQSRTKPVLAKAIETTPEALIVIMESGPVSIPWEKCSERLAHATAVERNRAELSSSGYGVHWPLIDEDLAGGPDEARFPGELARLAVIEHETVDPRQ